MLLFQHHKLSLNMIGYLFAGIITNIFLNTIITVLTDAWHVLAVGHDFSRHMHWCVRYEACVYTGRGTVQSPPLSHAPRGLPGPHPLPLPDPSAARRKGYEVIFLPILFLRDEPQTSACCRFLLQLMLMLIENESRQKLSHALTRLTGALRVTFYRSCE